MYIYQVAGGPSKTASLPGAKTCNLPQIAETMKLNLVLESNQQNWSLEPNRDYVVGRGSDCEICLADASSLSDRHLKFSFEAETKTWHIYNLDSSNSTSIGDLQIADRAINSSTTIVLGGEIVMVATPINSELAEESFAANARQAKSLLGRFNLPKWQQGLIAGGSVLVLAVGVPKIFDWASDFNTLHPIYDENKFGYINRWGVAIEPQFNAATQFSEGLAAVLVGQKWGYINEAGDMVINPQFEPPRGRGSFEGFRGFSEGLALVNVGNKWGYINKKGEFAINPQFDGGSKFSEGLAAVSVKGEWGYIDKSGKFVINPQFSYGDRFSDGLAGVRVGGKRFGFIDPKGKFVINPQFDSGSDFSEGLAAVSVDGKWGYVDKKGKFAINPQFDRAYSFSEGLARVRVGNKWGYVDPGGKIVINPQFDISDYHNEEGSFSEGLAAVSIDRKLGYINKKGEFAIPREFDYAGEFRNGLAQVSKEGQNFYINKKGKAVWKQTEKR
ncbi:MAG: FHA domain-containing protein [Oscillatoria sp. SIO1A7]|nr:FHA domain-containing protein [Oscillatoria sp. SIO1A7]